MDRTSVPRPRRIVLTELAPGAITTADLYRELTSMTVKLAVIEAQTTAAQHVDTEHENRLRALERFKWALFGGAATVGAGAGVIAALITSRGH